MRLIIRVNIVHFQTDICGNELANTNITKIPNLKYKELDTNSEDNKEPHEDNQIISINFYSGLDHNIDSLSLCDNQLHKHLPFTRHAPSLSSTSGTFTNVEPLPYNHTKHTIPITRSPSKSIKIDTSKPHSNLPPVPALIPSETFNPPHQPSHLPPNSSSDYGSPTRSQLISTPPTIPRVTP